MKTDLDKLAAEQLREILMASAKNLTADSLRGLIDLAQTVKKQHCESMSSKNRHQGQRPRP